MVDSAGGFVQDLERNAFQMQAVGMHRHPESRAYTGMAVVRGTFTALTSRIMRLTIPTTQNVFATHRMLGAFAAIGVFGLVALTLTALIGFEEPNSILLLISCLLIFAAPAAMVVHLTTTTELTREEKRRWIREFTGSRAASALADYLTSRDRRAALNQRLEEASARSVRPS